MSFVRQPLFYPASTVFLDDNADFLHALRGILAHAPTNRFFTKPGDALRFITAHHRDVPTSRLAGPAYSDFEKNGGNAYGQDALFDTSRFEEVAAIVVDYEMPEMNGIEFLSSVRNISCTKILLTGIAGDSEAVEAFNDGLIDFYLKKSDVRTPGKLAMLLADARRKHCAQRGHIGIHDVGTTYCDTRTAAALNAVVAREHIVEYYWRPEQNAVLTFDEHGNPGLFLAWSEADWTFQCEIVTDEGGPAELRAGMEARRIMPLFWPFQAFRPDMAEIRSAVPVPVPDWDGTFHSWTKLEPRDLVRSPTTYAQWRKAQA